MEKFNLNQIAMMTGLTTRTLRTYLNMGLLSGNKENNTRTFTEDNIENFFNDPIVKQALKEKEMLLYMISWLIPIKKNIGYA